jgi:hypothetical protein
MATVKEVRAALKGLPTDAQIQGLHRLGVPGEYTVGSLLEFLKEHPADLDIPQLDLKDRKPVLVVHWG